MRFCGSFFCALFLLLAHFANGQPNWLETISPVFKTLSDEAADSIAARRTEADGLRTEMDKIMQSRGFDRIFFFGKNDEYLKEGMNVHFTRAPLPMTVTVDRDPEVVRLEKLHAKLYSADKAISHWLAIQTKLKNHPDKSKSARWAAQYNALPPSKRPDPQSPAACQAWVTDVLICELADAIQTSNPHHNNEKIRSFDPKFIEIKENNSSPLDPKKELPISPDELICSFPMNGQFAFHLSESNPKVGYVSFTQSSMRAIYTLSGKPHEIRARWISSDRDVQYTAAELRSFGHTIFFNLPGALGSGLVYRLDLVAIPTDFKMPELPIETCRNIYRNKWAVNNKLPNNETIAGETIITTLYFRAGKYDVRKKMETMKGTIDWDRGAIIYATDEPLDPLELKGNGIVPAPVHLDVQTSPFYKLYDALNSPAVYYYLTVPKVEPIGSRPASDLLAAELDNTLDAPFIRNTALGNPRGYVKFPEFRDKPILLFGNYQAPPFARRGLRDSLVTSKPVPFINKGYFENNQLKSWAPVQCTLYVGELRQLVSGAILQQAQLRDRLDERVDFFYKLEERRAAREGKPLTVTKEQVREQEMANLPPEVKLLLDASIPACFVKDFSLLCNRKFPGTEMLGTSLDIKF